MVGHHPVAFPTQDGQIAGLLITEIVIGAMVHLDGDAIVASLVAHPAAMARGLQLSEPDGISAPVGTADVFLIIHVALSLVDLMYVKRGRRATL
jgi:hypothetical protein